jgi:hypothetical protein
LCKEGAVDFYVAKGLAIIWSLVQVQPLQVLY